MYVASVKARKVHIEHCPYCHRIKEENKKEYLHLDDGVSEGYVLCQYCSITNKKLIEQKELIDFTAKRHKLKYKMVDGMIVIDDGMSKWKIYYSRQHKKMVLYHQNYLGEFPSNKKSPIAGYHLQNVELKRLVDVFDYINDHFHAYLNNVKLPVGMQNRAKDIFYNERNHKRPRKKVKNTKKEKLMARKKAVSNVFDLLEQLRTVN